jgi:hypothetical protein
MRDEIAQDVKDLGPELDRLVAVREFVALGIEAIIAKNVTHVSVRLQVYIHVVATKIGPHRSMKRL